jgi:6-pyruvoyltetrahydropterin/6-carboxytetrahydropterin synthase
MAVVIWEKLKKRLQPDMKLKIKLFETPRNFVEFDGAQS